MGMWNGIRGGKKKREITGKREKAVIRVDDWIGEQGGVDDDRRWTKSQGRFARVYRKKRVELPGTWGEN